jgi:threonine/homoserine/homoserine lactone efflux protein
VTVELIFGFALVSFFACLTPGPATLLMLTHGARFGFRDALPTGLGITATALVYGLAAMTGLGALLAVSKLAFTIIRWVGAAYIMWLGIKLIRSARSSERQSAADQVSTRRPGERFWQGMVVGASNPKAIAFYTAVFPQFINTSAPQLSHYAALLVVLGVTVLLSLSLWAAGGMRVAAWMERPLFARWFQRTTGGLFVGSGVGLAFADR